MDPPAIAPTRDSLSRDCTFAFNNSTFSDRVLVLEIIPDSPDYKAASVEARAGSTISSCTGDDSTQLNDSVIGTKIVYVNTAVLVIKSPFFFKLCNDGIIDTEKRRTTLRIHASEEAALMELVYFIYTNKLTTKEPSAIVDVLKAAYKYEVEVCMNYCTNLLLQLPMTCELAKLYLDLPSNISKFSPLIDAGKQYLVDHCEPVSP